jgi:ADP-heptose:LPS heptosyltransferase
MVVHRSRKILVIHPGALGDVLQAVSALVGLRALGEGSHLTFAGQMRLGRLLAGTGLVDEALPFDGLGLEALFASDPAPRSVRSPLARFDRVISWFGARAEPFPERLRAIVPEALLAPPVPVAEPSLAVWEYLVRTLAPWGVAVPAELAPLRLPEAWRIEARLTLSRLGVDRQRPLLVVHPGAGGKAKRWPAKSFARVIQEVVRESGCQLLVHQGPADADAVEQLVSALDRPLILLREPSLDLLAAVLQEASAYLGADSGVSHLAASVGAPSVILFPPAARARWAPWSPTALPLVMSDGVREVEAVARAVSERLAFPGRTTSSLAQSSSRRPV